MEKDISSKVLESNEPTNVIEALAHGVPIVLTDTCFGCDYNSSMVADALGYRITFYDLLKKSKTRFIHTAKTCGSRETVENAGKIWIEKPDYRLSGGLSEEKIKELDSTIQTCKDELEKAEQIGREKFYEDLVQKL